MTSQVAVLPLTVVAVIVAVPAATAVTLPCFGVTVATSVLLELNVTVLSVASAGVTVATNVSFTPCARDNVVLLSVTPVGATLLGQF